MKAAHTHNNWINKQPSEWQWEKERERDTYTIEVDEAQMFFFLEFSLRQKNCDDFVVGQIDDFGGRELKEGVKGVSYSFIGFAYSFIMYK